MKYFKKALLTILPLLVTLSGIGCGEEIQGGAKLTISSVIISNITDAGATISWTTNQPSGSTVQFGTSASTKERTVISDQKLVTNHSITITNLESNNTYYFEVVSDDAASNRAVSTGYHFATLAEVAKTPSDQSNNIENIREAVQAYITYEKSEQWDEIWSTLHPDSQALFSSKDEFIQQEKNDNAEVSLKSFTIVNIEIIPQWTYASEGNLVGTDKTYSNVAQIELIITYSTPLKDEERSRTMYSVNYGGKWTFLHGKRGSTQSTNTSKIVIKYSSASVPRVGSYAARPGNTYLIFTLDIQNQGCDSFRVDPFLFKAVVSKIKYPIKQIAIENPLGKVDLSNGDKAAGKIAFEVPKGALLRLVYEPLQSCDIEWIEQ